MTPESDAPLSSLVDVHDLRTGRTVTVEVPEAAGTCWLGWGAAPRVRDDVPGDPDPRYGVLVKATAAGLVYLDEAGAEHLAPFARARVFLPSEAVVEDPAEGELAKALKAGQRWITVHPHGGGSTGVPVLIQEHPDGSARIIGGAGGKLTHLILRNVASKEEHARKARERAKERAQEERERKAAQTPEAAAQEEENSEAVREMRRREERSFVERTRAALGGVREDLSDADRTKMVEQGLTDAQIKAIEGAHHRAQYKEAVQRAREVLAGLAGRSEGQAHQRAALDATEEDPALHQARELAMAALDAEEEARAAARGLRQTNRERVTGGDPEVDRRATEAIVQTIAAQEDPAEEIQRIEEIPPEQRKASDEMARRVAEARARAKALLDAASQAEPPADNPVVAQILEEAGAEPGSAEAAEALRRAAAASWRASEALQAKQELLEQKEAKGEEGVEQAKRALELGDKIKRLARDRSEAVRLGLTDTVQAGLKEVDLAAAQALAEDFARHQRAQKELRELAAAVEGPDFDRARRVFDLQVSQPPPNVQETVEDEVRRSLTEKLLGVASPQMAAYQTAVAAGHHDGLADVALGLAGKRYIDRLVMDALGPRHAAMLIRHGLERDGHDTDAVLEALERHHVQQVTDATARALARAEQVAPGLQEQLGEVGDFEKAAAALKLHEADIAEAQRVVGTTIGKLEATAALAQTLRQPLPDAITLDARRAGLDRTLAWLHAAGLRPEHYTVVEQTEPHTIRQVTIPRASWDALLTRTDPGETKLREHVQAVKRGDHDEEGWLPPGIVRREASTFTAPVPEAARDMVPLDLASVPMDAEGKASVPELRAAIERHAGSRLADGEHPADIVADLLSAERVKAAPDQDTYVDTVKAAFPILDEEGEIRKFDPRAFEGMAESFMRSKYGDIAGAFHAQDLGVDRPETHEALFRALAAHPDGAIAFKPTGELTRREQRFLRERFESRLGVDPKVGYHEGRWREVQKIIGDKPPATVNLFAGFGGGGENNRERRWRIETETANDLRDGKITITAALNRLDEEQARNPSEAHEDLARALRLFHAYSSKSWTAYVSEHGSLSSAYRALQDEARTPFLSRFREEYGKLTGRGLKAGVAEVHNAESHAKAMLSPEEAAERLAERRARMMSVRQRDAQGRLVAHGGEGSVVAAMQERERQDTARAQAQGALFTRVSRVRTEPKLGERLTLGERAENQIASLMPHLGAQFQPGRPISLFAGLNMDGARAPQQRVLKHLDATKRVIGALGTGSGKSLISIGGFTQAHAKGEAQHGLYLVPSAVADQFGGEMLRYTEPGKYRWKVSTGLGHEDRVKMLKDPSLHMRVFTHQAFRDTALRIMADHHGVNVDEMKRRLAATTPRGRAELLRQAFDAEGIPRHFTYYDEAHTAEKREDTDPSTTNLVRSAVTHPVNATHYLHGTATPVKNDAGELFSVAETIDPDRYADRGKFLQDFGQDTAHNAGAIRRELAPYLFTARIDPDVTRNDLDNPTVQGGGGMYGAAKKVGGGPLPLLPDHQKIVDHVGQLYERARAARREGRADVAALRELSPSAFRGQPESEHETIAARLNDSLGIVKEAALRRAINGAPAPVNTKLQAMTRVIKHDLGQRWTDRQGKTRQGRRPVIFTDKASEARLIHEHLNAQGVRAALYHGGLTPQEREAIRLGFQPEDGRPPIYDAIVSTASAEAGVNLQSASVIHHYDVPQTWKSHAQRSGRAFRQGQQGDVDIHNWHTDTEYEQRARRRLAAKRELATVLEDPTAHLDEHGITAHYREVLAHRHQLDLAEAA